MIRITRMVSAAALALILTSNAHADWFVGRTVASNVFMSTEGSNCASFSGYLPAGPNFTPGAVAINPSGTRLYVLNTSPLTSNVLAINTATRASTSLPVGSSAHDLTASDSRLFTLHGSALIVTDTLSGTAAGQVILPGFATSVAVNAAGTRVYVTVGQAVMVIDAA